MVDFGEGTHPTVNFHPLLCHCIQMLLGFSTLLQTTPVDSVWPLGLVSPIFVAFVAYTADVPPQGMLLIPFEASLSNISDVFCG